MAVNYETDLGTVSLDFETVKQYLVKGDDTVTDKEVFLFIKMCEAQKLNPFVTGEVYLIKFGQQPAQMVIGYDTYKRRADDNPAHLYIESGIVVCRGQSGEIVQKAGACLYPSETLVGGWCRVHRLRGEREVTTFKEVSFIEYDKGKSIWKDKPCTMIEKVAISQCLREAYPKDYDGLYTEEELAPVQHETTTNEVVDIDVVCDEIITQSDRTALFSKAHNLLGEKRGNTVIKQLIENEGLSSTSGMTRSSYNRVMQELDNVIRDTNCE